MFYKAAYYLCMGTGCFFAAVLLSTRFEAFFLNPAVQIGGTITGFIALFWLLNNRPERDQDEGSDRLANEDWDY